MKVLVETPDTSALVEQKWERNSKVIPAAAAGFASCFSFLFNKDEIILKTQYRNKHHIG